MSEHSPVQGKTPEQARRAEAAGVRQAARDARSPEGQLAELDKRPGNSARERERLAKVA